MSGLPIEKLPLVYVITGAFSIVSGPLIGRASDALGKFKVFAFGCARDHRDGGDLHASERQPLWVLVAVIVGLQIGIFSRMISASALMSALPKPSDRGLIHVHQLFAASKFPAASPPWLRA